MLRLLQVLVMAVLGFFAYQYISQSTHPAPARQTSTAVDTSENKPPESWQYGSPVQQQLYRDYWARHPHGPANRTDPLIEAESHMPSMWTPENPSGLSSAAPLMPLDLARRSDVVELKHARDAAYVNLQMAIQDRDDQKSKELYARIVQIDGSMRKLIQQGR